MRYLLGMIGAVAAALACTLFLASRLATFVVARNAFESPDDVANLHAMIFMAANIVALLVGWAIGWSLGRRLEGKPQTR